MDELEERGELLARERPNLLALVLEGRPVWQGGPRGGVVADKPFPDGRGEARAHRREDAPDARIGERALLLATQPPHEVGYVARRDR
jgi:hypothetical protein